MAAAITTVVHALQAAFGVYNLYLSSQAIQNLLNYEEKTKKAAEWSNEAERQLWKTRYTQATNVGAVLLNITSSIYLAVSAGSISRTATLGITAVNVAVLVAARQYVGGFWKGAAKIPLPGAGKYNHAVGDTQEIRLNMAYLMAAWIGSGVLSLLS